METTINNSKIKILQVLNVVFFLAMVAMNFLAEYLPLNGKDTGQISRQYPNLFVPANITFEIWGVIYLLLLIFCIYQLKSLFSKPDIYVSKVVDNIGLLFIASSILNACWIVAWHYEILWLSVVVMLLMLITLINLNEQIFQTVPYMTEATRFLLKASFGIYLGWICIATIANITAVLVSVGWTGFGITEQTWTCIMLIAGAIIGFITLIHFGNSFIGAAIIWAFIGVIIARNDAPVYEKYIIYTAGFGITLLMVGIIVNSIGSIFAKRKSLETKAFANHKEIHPKINKAH